MVIQIPQTLSELKETREKLLKLGQTASNCPSLKHIEDLLEDVASGRAKTAPEK